MDAGLEEVAGESVVVAAGTELELGLELSVLEVSAGVLSEVAEDDGLSVRVGVGAESDPPAGGALVGPELSLPGNGTGPEIGPVQVNPTVLSPPPAGAGADEMVVGVGTGAGADGVLDVVTTSEELGEDTAGCVGTESPGNGTGPEIGPVQVNPAVLRPPPVGAGTDETVVGVGVGTGASEVVTEATLEVMAEEDPGGDPAA